MAARVLVTGSGGLVGTALLKRAAEGGFDAVPYDIRTGHDICDPSGLAAALDGCDGIIHLAAISRVAWGEADPALTDHVNVTGTAVLLYTALTRKHRPWVVFASSREVYGDPERLPVTEDMRAAPVNRYGRSKATGEELVQAAAGDGLHTAIVRLSNVYGGENDHPDRAIPSLLNRALSGLDLHISGRGTFFDFTHVEDCVDGILTAARLLHGGNGPLPPVHLASGIAVSLGELADLILGLTGSPSRLIVGDARPFDVKGFVGDPARAAAVLGWRTATPLAEGIDRYAGILRARARPIDPVQMPDLAYAPHSLSGGRAEALSALSDLKESERSRAVLDMLRERGRLA